MLWQVPIGFWKHMISTDVHCGHRGTHCLSRHLKRTKRIWHTWHRSGKKRCYWIEKYLFSVNPTLHKSESIRLSLATLWTFQGLHNPILHNNWKIQTVLTPKKQQSLVIAKLKSQSGISQHTLHKLCILSMWWYRTDLLSDWPRDFMQLERGYNPRKEYALLLSIEHPLTKAT